MERLNRLVHVFSCRFDKLLHRCTRQGGTGCVFLLQILQYGLDLCLAPRTQIADFPQAVSFIIQQIKDIGISFGDE